MKTKSRKHRSASAPLLESLEARRYFASVPTPTPYPVEGLPWRYKLQFASDSANLHPAIGDFDVQLCWGDDNVVHHFKATKQIGRSNFELDPIHIYKEEGGFLENSYPVEVTIKDLKNGLTADSYTYYVSVEDAHLTAVPVTVKTTVGATYKGVVAMFRDDNVNASATDFTATVLRIDPVLHARPKAVVISKGGGLFAVQVVEENFTRAENNNLQVDVLDDGRSPVGITSTLIVTAAKPAVMGNLAVSSAVGLGNAQPTTSRLTDEPFSASRLVDSALKNER